MRLEVWMFSVVMTLELDESWDLLLSKGREDLRIQTLYYSSQGVVVCADGRDGNRTSVLNLFFRC